MSTQPKPKALTLASFAQAKGFTAGTLTQFGVRTGRGGIYIPYYDAHGNEYVRSRVRDSADDGAGFRWTAGDAELIPYGLHRPVPYTKGFVWIVEGESDCWALWSHDIPALGIPGAASLKPLHAAHLEGVKTVAVVQEPGEAGERFPHRVAQKLYDDGFAGTVYAVVLPAKDPRALLLENPATFRDRLAEAFRDRREIPRPHPVTGPAVGTTSISMADLFDLPVEDTDWLVDGLLPSGGIGLLAAKAKVGKSVLARNLAIAVARGSRFLGRACKGGVVLWLALEERQDQVLASFKAMGASRHDPIRFHFGAAPADALAWLRAECEAHKVALVVIDTWHKLSLIEDINNYAAVNRANEPLMRLSREHGVAQIWIHHNNKGERANGDEVLGSSALFAAADLLISMRRADDGTRTIRSIQRIGDDMEDTVVEMDPDSFVIRSAGSKYVAMIERARPKVVQALQDASEPITLDDIAAAANARRQVVLAAVNEELRAGSIVKAMGSGKKGDPVKYALVEMSLGTECPDPEPHGRPRQNAVPEVPYWCREPREPGTESDIQFPSTGNRWEPQGTAGTAGTSGTAGTESAASAADDPDLLMAYAEERFGQ